MAVGFFPLFSSFNFGLFAGCDPSHRRGLCGRLIEGSFFFEALKSRRKQHEVLQFSIILGLKANES